MSVQGILLFSGGLDSLLAARVLMDQGLDILCLHYVSPFFGSPGSKKRWKELYGIDVEIADAGREMVELVSGWPEHGFGKVMNPCVDCKITLLKLAKKRLEKEGAQFLATGEVVGQRPMSQRRDIMNRIRREAGVEDLLLRPLCAQHLDPTPFELSGLVDRSRLLGLHGRGRQDQLDLARQYGWEDIPSPGGGCLLTERENARHYWPLRQHRPHAGVEDYRLARTGRQLWLTEDDAACWMIVARNNRDNERLRQAATGEDLLVGLCDFPGPLALWRDGEHWTEAQKLKAAAQFLSYAPRARQASEQAPDQPIRVWMRNAVTGPGGILSVLASESRSDFSIPSWEDVKAEKHALASRMDVLHKEKLAAERKARQLAWEQTHGQAHSQAHDQAHGRTQDQAPAGDQEQDPAGAPAQTQSCTETAQS